MNSSTLYFFPPSQYLNVRILGSVYVFPWRHLWFIPSQSRQCITLYMTAVRRVKFPFADVGRELGSDVSQRSIAGNNKGAIHAKFGTQGLTDTQLTCCIPHQLGEVPRLVLIGLIEEIVATYLIIPGKND